MGIFILHTACHVRTHMLQYTFLIVTLHLTKHENNGILFLHKKYTQPVCPACMPVCPACMPSLYAQPVCPACMPSLYAQPVCPACMPSQYAQPVCPACMPSLYAQLVYSPVNPLGTHHPVRLPSTPNQYTYLVPPTSIPT